MAGLYPYQQQFLKRIMKYTGRGVIQITGRRHMSSTSPNPDFIKMLESLPKQPIKWKRLPGLKLQAYVEEIQPRGFERGLRESDMDPIQAWSTECNCGVRTSFNVWKFSSEKQITMFLMKWSS